jgi:hypothetical protein
LPGRANDHVVVAGQWMAGTPGNSFGWIRVYQMP